MSENKAKPPWHGIPREDIPWYRPWIRTFPSLDAVWKLERERQIFMATVSIRAKVEVAGEFGDKQFLVRLEKLVEGRPFDIFRL